MPSTFELPYKIPSNESLFTKHPMKNISCKFAILKCIDYSISIRKHLQEKQVAELEGKLEAQERYWRTKVYLYTSIHVLQVLYLT